jgi:general secretion pathway protein G
VKRAGFTMIELVFVIVILGILASVAIPKLAATRDDAEVATGVQRVSNMITDIGGYYTGHGKYAEVEKMTKETLLKNTKTGNEFDKFDGNLTNKIAYFGNTARTKECLKVEIDDSNGTLRVTPNSDGSSYCNALIAQLGNLKGEHKFGGSQIYK